VTAAAGSAAAEAEAAAAGSAAAEAVAEEGPAPAGSAPAVGSEGSAAASADMGGQVGGGFRNHGVNSIPAARKPLGRLAYK